MTRNGLKKICNSFLGVDVAYPYGDDCVRAYKVGGRMFVFYTLGGELKVSLKAKPSITLELRKNHPEKVEAGFFNMQKTHWNTLSCVGGVKDSELIKLIEASYHLVVDQLPPKISKNLK